MYCSQACQRRLSTTSDCRITHGFSPWRLRLTRSRRSFRRRCSPQLWRPWRGRGTESGQWLLATMRWPTGLTGAPWSCKTDPCAFCLEGSHMAESLNILPHPTPRNLGPTTRTQVGPHECRSLSKNCAGGPRRGCSAQRGVLLRPPGRRNRNQASHRWLQLHHDRSSWAGRP